jgi:hypothetical protein
MDKFPRGILVVGVLVEPLRLPEVDVLATVCVDASVVWAEVDDAGVDPVEVEVVLTVSDTVTIVEVDEIDVETDTTVTAVEPVGVTGLVSVESPGAGLEIMLSTGVPLIIVTIQVNDKIKRQTRSRDRCSSGSRVSTHCASTFYTGDSENRVGNASRLGGTTPRHEIIARRVILKRTNNELDDVERGAIDVPSRVYGLAEGTEGTTIKGSRTQPKSVRT